MSGHSKWATTKRQKAATDAKRSGLFTKLSKNISVAAREGADPDFNFKLRMAIDQAKTASMPKDNIERAVQRGSGTGDGVQLERIMYEGFGPGGIAVLVETITDNKNRTFSDIKHFFSSHSGNLGASNAVAWMFDVRGVITIAGSLPLNEEHELQLIDRGLIDTEQESGSTVLVTEFEKLQGVKEAAENLGLIITDASVNYIAKDLVPPKEKEAATAFLDALSELDDVDNVYTNADL